MTCQHFCENSSFCRLLQDVANNRNNGTNSNLGVRIDVAAIELGSENGGCPSPMRAKRLQPFQLNGIEFSGCPVGFTEEYGKSIPNDWFDWLIISFYKLMTHGVPLNKKTVQKFIE